ncbi:MAG: hypothetical protein IKF82_08300 [Bacilli bacterium]|nr:hypothetical protein [Bacilli bacterium]
MLQDREIQEQMMQEGKIKISNFNKMIEKYFESKYNKRGYFEFLYVEYEFYDENYKIYNLDIGDYVSRPQKRKIKTMLPFFIEPGAIDDIRTFSLKIPGIIDIDNLNSEISNHLPNGVTLITDSQIDEILLNEGYTEPFFDHYFYSLMDYPSFNLYAKPIAKSKNIDSQTADSNSKQTEIIETENCPQNIPDNETCKILDDLLSKNQLPARKVKYCIGPIMTDYYDEYNYNGRRFIRYSPTINQPNNIRLHNNDEIGNNKFYWIEVKPIEYDDPYIGSDRPKKM